ncbi:MAG: type II toxin-antitoxin system VapC family toxin, partial [Bifidobacteriaceae bacterium]|nr:type II toxin-antitoxin system VapC family toxin [Bifidobacteriaceae bacterium]
CPERLAAPIAAVLAEPQAQVFVSTVSLWELSVKFSLGKIDLAGHSPEEIAALAVDSGFPIAAPSATVCASSHRLPRRHGDPFDRLLVWQAIQAGQVLLSADRALAAYTEDGLRLVG